MSSNRAGLRRRLRQAAERMLQGSLVEPTRTCGNPGCRCHRGERHGPPTYLSFKTPEGRSSAVYVPAARLREAQAGVQASARFWTPAVQVAAQNRTEAVADLPDATVQARATQVRTLLAGASDRVVSCDDPEARWGYQAADKPFCGYTAHEALDPDSRLITALDVVPGNAPEAMRTDALLARDTPPRAEGAVVIGDAYYNNATTVAQGEAAQAQPGFSGPRAARVSDRFDYGATPDHGRCPEGKPAIGKVRVDNGDLYYFSMRDCAGCPRQVDCRTRGDRTGRAQPRRRVDLSDVRKRTLIEGAAGTAWRKGHLRVRGYIEPKCDEPMNPHGLRHARYWGLATVTLQGLLNAITVNANRAVKLLARAAEQPGRRPVEVAP